MKNQIPTLLLVYLVVSLSACASPTQIPTLTPLPTQTPTNTPAPIPTATILPTPTESPFPPEMTDKYINQFVSTEKGIRAVDGVDTNVIFGVKNDGAKQVIAMEIDGRMTRVGETIDENGNSFYVYINDEFSIGRRIAVNGETAKMLFGISRSKADVSIFKSIGVQLSLTPEETKDKIMANEGKMNFIVPIQGQTNSKYITNGRNIKAVQWVNLPNEANFNKPLEIIFVETRDIYDSLDTKIKSLLVAFEVSGEYNFIDASLLWVKPDGQIQIVVVSTGIEITPWVLNPKPEENNHYVNEFLSGTAGFGAFTSVHMISLISKGGNAHGYLMFFEIPTLQGVAERSFEYNGIKK